MTTERVLVILSLVVAIVAAFTNIPSVAIVFAILGLVVGNCIGKEDHVRVLVTALVLATGSGALDSIPAIGPHLTKILGNVGTIVAASAITIIAKNIWSRVMP